MDKEKAHQHNFGENIYIRSGRYWFHECDCGKEERWRTSPGYYKHVCPKGHAPEKDTVLRDRVICMVCGSEMIYVEGPEPLVPLHDEEQRLLAHIPIGRDYARLS